MKKWQELIQIVGQNRLQENHLFRFLIEVSRIDDLINIVKSTRNLKIQHYIIGTGSWAQMPSEKQEAILIKNNCRRFDVFAMSGRMEKGQIGIKNKLIYAESGTLINQLVRFSIEEELSGLEYHLGESGSLGGAIYNNRRYTPKNHYLNDVIDKITILNTDNHLVQLTPEDFISRTSSEFKQAADVIISATLRLEPSDKKILWERAEEASKYHQNLSFS